MNYPATTPKLTLTELTRGSKWHSNAVDEISIFGGASSLVGGGADSSAVADGVDIFRTGCYSSIRRLWTHQDQRKVYITDHGLSTVFYRLQYASVCRLSASSSSYTLTIMNCIANTGVFIVDDSRIHPTPYSKTTIRYTLYDTRTLVQAV
jgi:hypothetical protein